jgi:hypothetical protein
VSRNKSKLKQGAKCGEIAEKLNVVLIDDTMTRSKERFGPGQVVGQGHETAFLSSFFGS